MTAYNQIAIKNHYARNPWDAAKKFHQPYWGQKLFTPAYYKDEKFAKFLKQWSYRLNFEMIKMRHAIIEIPGDKQQKKMMKLELENYL